MNPIAALTLLLPVLTSSVAFALPELHRFAFGSCNFQNLEQPLWKDILRQRPELFVWGGDAIYADWADTTMAESYQIQLKQPDYQLVRKSIPMIGIWDDHDYASDNADGTYKDKKLSQKLFLDFLGEPEDSKRRTQEGIYTSYVYGKGDHQVRFILLDNRYFKDLDKNAAMLGEVQWKWLERELANTTAKVNFIVSGLSVLSPLIPISEEWADIPAEQTRLLKLVNQYKVPGVVFLTGDKHFASIFERLGHLEFLSSGMTHVAPRKTWWYLARHFPAPYFGLNYGQVDIDWRGTQPLLTLAIRGKDGRDYSRSKFELNAAGGWTKTDGNAETSAPPASAQPGRGN